MNDKRLQTVPSPEKRKDKRYLSVNVFFLTENEKTTNTEEKEKLSEVTTRIRTPNVWHGEPPFIIRRSSNISYLKVTAGSSAL